jgi:hypothetical protein
LQVWAGVDVDVVVLVELVSIVELVSTVELLSIVEVVSVVELVPNNNVVLVEVSVAEVVVVEWFKPGGPL